MKHIATQNSSSLLNITLLFKPYITIQGTSIRTSYHDPTIRRTPTYEPLTTEKNTINEFILRSFPSEKNTQLENNIQPLLHQQITKTIQDGMID